MISAKELAPGLILFLDPEILLLNGATTSCPPVFQVQGMHMFLCLEVGKTESKWVPMHSAAKYPRLPVPIGKDTGSGLWIEKYKTTNIEPRQVWTASNVSVVKASYRDLTNPASRNCLNREIVDELAGLVSDWQAGRESVWKICYIEWLEKYPVKA